jgi:3-hydroxyisobutyrate dehydrogenase-like beta-hydroxyacid dehydrogenase
VIDLSVIAATAAAAFAAQRKASHDLALLDNPVSGARGI